MTKESSEYEPKRAQIDAVCRSTFVPSRRHRGGPSVVSRDIPVCILRSDQTSPGTEPRQRRVPASCVRAARAVEQKNAGRVGERDRSVGEVIVEVIDQPHAEVAPRDPAAAVRAARSVIDLRIPP